MKSTMLSSLQMKVDALHKWTHANSACSEADLPEDRLFFRFSKN